MDNKTIELLWIFLKNKLSLKENKNFTRDKKILEIINSILETNYEELSLINFNEKEILIKILFFLIKNGYQIEDLAGILNWSEFEYLCMKIFEYHNFDCKMHYRFSLDKKRYEFDILCYKENLIIAIDAKHWSPRFGKKSAIKKFALKQDDRIVKFIKSNKIQELINWKTHKIIPLIITWYNEELFFIENIPIVPIYNLNNFLNNLYQYDMKCYKI